MKNPWDKIYFSSYLGMLVDDLNASLTSKPLNKQQNDYIIIKCALEMNSYYNLHPIVPEKYQHNILLIGTRPNSESIIFCQGLIAHTRARTSGLQ